MKRCFIRFMGVLLACVCGRSVDADAAQVEDFFTGSLVYAHAYRVSGDNVGSLQSTKDANGKSWGVCVPTADAIADSRNEIAAIYKNLQCEETAVGKVMSPNKGGGWFVPFFSGVGAGSGWNGGLSSDTKVRCKDTDGSFVYSLETSGGKRVEKKGVSRCCCVDGGVVCSYGDSSAGDAKTVFLTQETCENTGDGPGSGYGVWHDASEVSTESRYYIPVSKVNHYADPSEGGCESGLYATSVLSNVMYPKSKWSAGTGSDGLCRPCPNPINIADSTGVGLNTNPYVMQLSGHVIVSDRFGDGHYVYCDVYSPPSCETLTPGVTSCHVAPINTVSGILSAGVSESNVLTGSDASGKYFLQITGLCHATN